MPGGDGTGPAGMGPMTGRGAGLCAGYATPGFASAGFGRGFWGRGRGGGWARGGGWGWRNQYYATGLTRWQRAAYGYPAFAAVPFGGPPAGADEIEVLRGQAAYFEDALEGIKKRIEELELKAKPA